MDQASLDWLSSYLEDWAQYVVVEASRSRKRKMTKGAPQGGGLSPILWRSTTNDIPEAGLVDLGLGQQRPVPAGGGRQAIGGLEGQVAEAFQDLISKKIDMKKSDELTTEEKLDKKMRREGKWDLEGWRKERTGQVKGETDGLRQRMVEDPRDLITTIYADDTQSRAASKNLKDLEKRNGEGLTKVCNELKALRLKVNEGKTVYMVLATPGIRRRDGQIASQIQICGKVVKNVKKGKVLGLVVSDDLSWRDQIDKVAKSCTTKLSGLWRCTSVLNRDQRKTKAEGIVLSRLFYCLETTSTGLKSNMERLQGVQSAAARWVLQVRRRDWSLRGGMKKLGWLSICQQAAYQSVKLAIKILQSRKPERLYESLTHIQNGLRVRKVWTVEELMRLNLSTRKAWSTRALRWIDMMPAYMLDMDISLKSSKEKLKAWIKHRVPPRGDKVLWGKLLREAGVQARAQEGRDQGPDDGQLQDAGSERTEDLVQGDGTTEVAQASQARSATSEEGSTVIQRQVVGVRDRQHLQAGHQLCPPRRRQSPGRGIMDTTRCPWWRAAHLQVIHIHCVILLMLILSITRTTLETGGLPDEARTTCRMAHNTRETKRVLRDFPRVGVG